MIARDIETIKHEMERLTEKAKRVEEGGGNKDEDRIATAKKTRKMERLHYGQSGLAPLTICFGNRR